MHDVLLAVQRNSMGTSAMLNANPPTVVSSILTYTAYYLGLALLVNIVLWAAETFANVVLQPSALAWLPPILAAMQAGQRYGMRTQSKPSGGYMWLASFGFVVVSFLLSIALIYALVIVYHVDISAMIDAVRADFESAGLSFGTMSAILAGVALLLWVLLRFAFSFGAGTGIKAAAAKANR
jgi:hypothetical protein